MNSGDSGSSPRVRGSLCVWEVRQTWRRFIPARAGEPSVGRLGRLATGVHPRACGGAMRSAILFTSASGSSPRVRGSLPPALRRRRDLRFIPARAGEPRASSTPARRAPVHPRACGGAPRGCCRPSSAMGSSPRVRGSPAPHRLQRRPWRFIPARAGEPRRASARSVPWMGSSPRVRGSRRHHRRDHGARRFIPARAGEPPSAWAITCS